MAEVEMAEAKNDHDEDHDEHHATCEDTEPYRLHVMMDEQPYVWFAVFCCLYLLNIAILLPLILALGNDAIYLTTDVPMYMRGHQSQKNQDALVAGWDEATFELESEINRNKQETPADIDLTLAFISDQSEGLGNEAALNRILEVVNHVIDANDYDKYCRRIYTNADRTEWKCVRPSSLTDFFDPEYFEGALNSTYDVEPTLSNYNGYFVPSLISNPILPVENHDFTDENIEKISKYWAEYGEGTLETEYGKGIYDGREMQSIFYFYTSDAADAEINQLSNFFEALADQKFGETPEQLKIEAALAIIRFGYPIGDYTSDSDDTEGQDEEISEWAYNELHDYFFDLDVSEFTLYWGCGTMRDFYLQEIIVQDMTLLIITIMCVWLYTVYTLKSFFLACFGMLMIFMNFAPALLLYRYISQIKYFGTLNLLSIFIILSIGADDIFVLCDVWEQTRAESLKSPMPKRLTFTLNHAAKVMFTTSISTIFSFLGNTTSEFPAVYTFGGFAAWLVWVNYCGVVLFFPSVLVVHERLFWTPTVKYPWCIPKQCVESQAPECCLSNLNAKKEEFARKSQVSKDEPEERRPIDLWFENSLHTFIVRWRWPILFLFTVFFVIFLGFAAQLEPDPDPPQFFPDGNNYYEYDYALLDYFGSADNLRITNEIVIGIEGIDRDGTDEAIEEDYGSPVWDPNYDLSSVDGQMFVAQFCDDLVCGFNEYDCRYNDLWHDLLVEEPSTPSQLDVLRCWMTEFRTWVENDPDAILSTTEQEDLVRNNNITEDQGITAEQMEDCNYGTFPLEPYYCYNILLSYVWARDELPTSNPDYRAGVSNYDYWKTMFGVEDTDDEAILRFNVIELELDAYQTTEYREGMDLWDLWNTYIDRWLDSADGDYTQDKNGDDFVAAPLAVQSMFFTDTRVWTYFFVQDQIIYESLTGIALSLSLAFMVLVAATGNWIIAIMAISTITQLVILIMGFTVMQGYKLGVMEAIIFVMVVGMVVDYVVHCSEAYLHAKPGDRVGRSKGMLGLVGMSVVSGSFSTVVGVVWMLLATIAFFFKFGTSILFQEATSLTYALIYYTALLSVAGPQNKDGDVKRDLYRIKSWCEWRYSMWCGDGSVPEPDWGKDLSPKKKGDHAAVPVTDPKPEGPPVTSEGDVRATGVVSSETEGDEEQRPISPKSGSHRVSDDST